jgi:predicted transcriptional regulator
MAATSIKLPDDLKARIAPLAEAAGLSPHAWMLRALAEETERAEKRAAFMAEGLRRLQEVRDGGELLPACEVFARLEARLEAGLLAKSGHRAG